ncbi:SDR family NAD(P)-dependent oxidoreductase [Thermoflexibacter ruber]|uniref:NAD(P)-dependent dehydrogenase, short-chain alcohol dehydrogenase family n=1 Tax=Thermoflexibacter ruber TaxID=1003 RepID=A0A1I2JNN7_9BACT|nr:SDR family NAD(P)-dependent oxidoreductase [Thermoflexibacter ruber]SFF54321.1 NAD(P)-dependent dehydrogenase, short-chain alcohol dehydrogenase family [Thermoflexibacter ruber]
MNNVLFKGKNVIITGGTDGMGAATAIELCKLGANVHIVGRSEEKAKNVQKITEAYSGKLTYSIADFSLLRNIKAVASSIAAQFNSFDIVIHAVGILITNTQHTEEGLEKDFAVSYLSRFVFNEHLFSLNKFNPKTKIINIAASSPKVPSFAQMEFDNVSEVKSRVGMKSHGQAQLANDLYTAIAGKRYGVISIGYGPGSVDTNIRREVPVVFQWLMKPFFYFATRKPIDVAKQFIEILTLDNLQSGNAYYFNKKGQFKIATFIDNQKRQDELLNTTLAILNPILSN